MTLLVHQTEPARAALHARVLAAGDGWFVPDRTILHASDRAYGHETPCDRGEVLGGGHKAKVVKVRWGREGLVHHVRGPVPALGEAVRLHLDEDRRKDWMRAHAAAHALAAAVLARGGELDGFPITQGGSRVRARFRLRDPAGLLEDVNRILATAGAESVAHLVRKDAERRVVAGSWLPDGEPIRVVGPPFFACDAPPLRALSEAGTARWAGAPRTDAGGTSVQLVAGSG